MSATSPSRRMPLGILFHVYYPEVATEILPLLKRISIPFDLNVNFVQETYDAKADRMVRSMFPNSFTKISENRGLGCGGFQSLAQDPKLAQVTYEKLLILHTKKATGRHDEIGRKWRESLLMILKDRNTIEKCLRLLDTKGAVAPQNLCFAEAGCWEGHAQKIRELCELSDIPYGVAPFVAGSMFWARGELWDVMRRIRFPVSRFEPGYVAEGAYAHAFERFYGVVAAHYGGLEPLSFGGST